MLSFSMSHRCHSIVPRPHKRAERDLAALLVVRGDENVSFPTPPGRQTKHKTNHYLGKLGLNGI